jgi:hypothetical protein
MKSGYLFHMGHEWQLICMSEQQYYVIVFVCKCIFLFCIDVTAQVFIQLCLYVYGGGSYEVAVSLYV